MEKWILLIVTVFLLIFLEWMREIRTYKITRYKVSSKKLNGIKRERKIIFLSDLHNYCYGKNNEKLINTIKREQPDYILVAGDMVVGKPGVSTKVAEDLMVQLPAICPVYYANGNHEQRMQEFPSIYGDSFEQYKNIVENAGVQWLSNKKISKIWDGVPVEIYGLELPNKKYKKFMTHSFLDKDVTEALGDANKEVYDILIAHNPVFVDSYLDWGADLVLSGHFHGGVVRLPIIGGVITPMFSIFPKYSGEMTKVDDATVVVSKGLGLHTIKVRLFNPAEVVVMHINGTEE